MSSYICSFIKFVEKKEYAEDFMAGNLYCNPWVSFEYSEDRQRKDETETAGSILNWQLSIQAINTQTTNIRYKFLMKDIDNFNTPVFCLYSVLTKKNILPNKLHIRDKRLREFGKYGVVVREVEEFIKRLETRLPGFSYGLIEYLNFNNLSGKNKFALRNPIIQKDKTTFSHQQEFRIYNKHITLTNELSAVLPTKEVVLPNENGAARFSIGDINDIAEIHSMDELFCGIDLQVNVKNWGLIHRRNLAKELWWDGTKYQKISAL